MNSCQVVNVHFGVVLTSYTYSSNVIDRQAYFFIQIYLILTFLIRFAYDVCGTVGSTKIGEMVAKAAVMNRIERISYNISTRIVNTQFRNLPKFCEI